MDLGGAVGGGGGGGDAECGRCVEGGEDFGVGLEGDEDGFGGGDAAGAGEAVCEGDVGGAGGG